MGGHAFGQALRRLQCDDEGAATAEFAVVLPVIVMLAALMLYFGPGIRRVGRVPGRGGQRRAGVDGAGERFGLAGHGSGGCWRWRSHRGASRRNRVRGDRPLRGGGRPLGHRAENGDGACTWHMAGEAMKEVAKWVCEGVRPGEG